MKMMMLAAIWGVGTSMALTGCLTNECSSLRDCGDGERCGGDGVCVPAEDTLAIGSGARGAFLGNAGDGTDAPAVEVIPSTDTGEDWSGPGWRVVGGNVRGNVAGVVLDPAGDFAPASGVAVISSGEGADGLILVTALTPEDWTRIVTRPGLHTFGGSDFDAPVYGATCTLNETTVSHYDEPAQEIEIDVAAPEDDGTILVDVSVRNSLSDAAVTMILERVE